MNHHTKNVRIITTHSNTTHKQFVIPAGGSYEIQSTHSTAERLFVTAYDAQSFFPIKIDGKQSVYITACHTPVSLVYYIPSGELTTLTL